MFVGHLGAGLAAKAVARDVNLGIVMGARCCCVCWRAGNR